MAPLFSKADLNKFWHDVQNEVTLICAKFGKDLFSISKVIGRKTKWSRFFGLPCMWTRYLNVTDRWTDKRLCRSNTALCVASHAENRHHKTKAQPRKANNTEHSKTKLAWFSRFLRHSARKRAGLILQRSRAHRTVRQLCTADNQSHHVGRRLATSILCYGLVDVW